MNGDSAPCYEALARGGHLVGQEQEQPESEEAPGSGRQADAPVDDDGPQEGLQQGVGDAQQRRRQREGPGGVEEVVALRVEDGERLHHHRHLAEPARQHTQPQSTCWVICHQIVAFNIASQFCALVHSLSRLVSISSGCSMGPISALAGEVA